jgi:hypothetical protein
MHSTRRIEKKISRLNSEQLSKWLGNVCDAGLTPGLSKESLDELVAKSSTQDMIDLKARLVELGKQAQADRLQAFIDGDPDRV